MILKSHRLAGVDKAGAFLSCRWRTSACAHQQGWTAVTFIADRWHKLDWNCKIFVDFSLCSSAVVWCCPGFWCFTSMTTCVLVCQICPLPAWGYRLLLLSFHCKKNSPFFCRTSRQKMLPVVATVDWNELNKTKKNSCLFPFYHCYI